jgi:hypothetical protein
VNVIKIAPNAGYVELLVCTEIRTNTGAAK